MLRHWRRCLGTPQHSHPSKSRSGPTGESDTAVQFPKAIKVTEVAQANGEDARVAREEAGEKKRDKKGKKNTKMFMGSVAATAGNKKKTKSND